MFQSQLNPDELLRDLGITHIEHIEPIGDGWGDTMLWRVEHSGHMVLLRVFPPNQRHVRDREVDVMRAVDTVPVPRVEAVGDPKGLPAMLISWCPGITVFEALSTSPERAEEIGSLMGCAQARIHSNAVSDRLRAVLRHDWMSWGGDSNDSVARKLRGVVSDTESIIHLDFHPLNVMIDGDGISGVIDWTNAQIGDPRADIARTYSILTWIPLPPNERSDHARRTSAEFRRAWLRSYQMERGKLLDMPPFLAWAARATSRDLGRKIGQPGFWMKEHDFERLGRRVDRWERLAQGDECRR